MEVSITQFRRELFELVGRAMSGDEVWVAHRGRRFRVAPEDSCGTRLGRLTPFEVVDPEAPAMTSGLSLQEEMTRAWESDWSTL